jgi:hypothetical protein
LNLRPFSFQENALTTELTGYQEGNGKHPAPQNENNTEKETRGATRGKRRANEEARGKRGRKDGKKSPQRGLNPHVRRQLILSQFWLPITAQGERASGRGGRA